MAEYWKSTPKYWCKYCKVYVRDTTFERKQHEATGRHQGGIQKSLRDLHRSKEQEQRDKTRAQNEVARLTGVVAGRPAPAAAASSAASLVQPRAPASKAVATAEDRRRQAAQLAAMGIAVPQEYRADVAMKGEWQTVAIHSTARSSAGAKEEDDAEENKDAIVKGVRKRRVDNDDEEEAGPRRPRWGRDVKTYRGQEEDVDLDALLQEPITLKHDDVKRESPLEDAADIDNQSCNSDGQQDEDDQEQFDIKHDDTDENPVADELSDAAAPAAGVVFKKRKSKQIRGR